MHGFRETVTVLVVLLAANVRAAGEGASNRFTVNFDDPKVVFVTDLSELNRLCRTPKPIHACTSFVLERFSSGCEQSDSAWSIVASVTASPVMYLSDAAFRLHETAHIAQIDGMVRRYLRKLTSRRFGTVDDCYRAEGREIIDFSWRMNTIRRQSEFLIH